MLIYLLPVVQCRSCRWGLSPAQLYDAKLLSAELLLMQVAAVEAVVVAEGLVVDAALVVDPELLEDAAAS